ncbi:DUF6250 domain-containing protein [Sphingomonas sp. 2R-10]|uniref:DUF6250 domain-containing protein n=1 Tax=Sphingomonas sp. 2R-10 TaxID=3045148 RepID=UPI000F7840DA|nr:DUF6250 domain-containing protein [Sphingomonas sp. 2R-10]MDJ0275849.1 DUF6250 domain-containing protein [Sphingomonas sp. 2R-10]
MQRTGRLAPAGGWCLLLLAGCAPLDRPAPAGWVTEAQDPRATVAFLPGGVIDIDTPAGLTLWHPQPLDGPVRITFEAMAVAAGGPNDRVSDLNAFWMATEPAGGTVPGRRSGRFEDYDTLTTYYVGIGGNGNTTTRMRRYTGRAGDRPLLPQHDRRDPGALLQPDRWTRIALVADGTRIAVERDGRPLFALQDPQPYRRGWFALRTTQSHLRIRGVTIARP